MDPVAKFIDFYFKYYKLLIFIPLILLFASFASIFLKYRAVNDIFEKDVSLKGGISLTVYTQQEVSDLQQYLEKELNTDVLVRRLAEFGSDKQLGLIVEVSGVGEKELKEALEKRLENIVNYSVEETGPSLGESFYNQMLRAMLFAFLFISITVFIIFRNVLPSLFVIFGIFADITTTIGVIDLLGLRISTAGIAALLLLIGYSLDTDVLLTVKVLKKKEGSLQERFMGAMKTGLTMTITSIVAMLIGYVLSTSIVLKEMFLIILIGLFADIIFTYLFNGSILVLYLGNKK